MSPTRWPIMSIARADACCRICSHALEFNPAQLPFSWIFTRHWFTDSRTLTYSRLTQSRVFFLNLHRESRSPTLISAESEELNRVLVLTLARAMHVTGSEASGAIWTKEFLSSIKNNTPHAWSAHTLNAFPQALQDFYQVRPRVARATRAWMNAELPIMRQLSIVSELFVNASLIEAVSIQYTLYSIQ